MTSLRDKVGRVGLRVAACAVVLAGVAAGQQVVDRAEPASGFDGGFNGTTIMLGGELTPASSLPQEPGALAPGLQAPGLQAPGLRAPGLLPPAPSTLLVSQQGESLAKTAGSGFVWNAAVTTRGPGGAVVEHEQDGLLKLGLDDAISLGLTRNLRMRYDQENLKAAKGLVLGVLNVFTPNLTVDGSSQAQEINLAAMGFKQSLIASSGLLPAGVTFSTIVKVKTTQGSINLRQTLFSMPDFELFKATTNVTRGTELAYRNDRGDLVTTVGQAYLKVLADQANVVNAQAQERSARTLYEQAKAKLEAGVGTNLDMLRGRVEYQQRQQQTIQAETQVAEDTIQLNRTMGMPAGQRLELTDTAPFAELGAMDESAALATAYIHRKDLLELEQQIAISGHVLKAAKYQRLPVLAFNGFYGVIGLTDTGAYHGNFNAEGTLSVPLFREAAQRGETEVASAQLVGLRQQEESLRVTIDAQIRAAMLDVESSGELVKVAQSSVGLAQEELSDERDRFAAGVDDDLPVVDAEASVAQSQSQLVSALYQYNVAKLTLARNVGVVETRYRSYLAGR